MSLLRTRRMFYKFQMVLLIHLFRMAATLAINSYWADKAMYDDAEKRYYENLAKVRYFSYL